VGQNVVKEVVNNTGKEEYLQVFRKVDQNKYFMYMVWQE
jgi:hypothetical protein